jgi:hypothetical protein
MKMAGRNPGHFCFAANLAPRVVPAFAGTTMEIQLLSLSSLGMCEPSPADSRPVLA